MATTQLAPSPVFRSWDNNGNPLVNGKLNTYAAGTSTPQTTYTDSTGNTPNINPVILNSRGEANVWLNPSLAYKFILTDSLNNQLWSVDNITSPIIQTPFGNTSGTNTITVNTTPNFSTLTDGLSAIVKIANTNTGAVTFNLNSTGALNAYYSDGVTQIIAGALIQNNIYTLVYDSSLNSSLGGWVVQNPSRSTGSFTITLATGWTTTPTGTVNYSILPDGKTAYVYIAAAITGTSNAGNFSCTGWPAILQPTTSKKVGIMPEDNTAMYVIPCLISINSGSGTITLGGNVAGSANFTASGTKGFIAGTEISFTLD